LPCYNEEEVLPLIHERITKTLGNSPDFDLELVYVNDGSSDKTEEMLFSLAESDARVNVLSLSRNFGHQSAVCAGLEHTSGDVVAVIDADLQDPPEVILEMLGEWRKGYDAVYAVRAQRKENFVKRLAYASFYRIYRVLANVPVPLDAGDFSIMDRRVVDVINSLPEKNRFVRGLRAWVGFRQKGFTYERAPRAAGEPKYTFWRLIKLATDGIFNFSTVPLTLIFLVGVAVSFAAALGIIVYFVAWMGDFTIFGRSPKEAPGFTTLILALFFLSGFQLVSLGILGEYLGRIYQETKIRPTYVVKNFRSRSRTGDVTENQAPSD
jgi:dolichol-phosphate mannosyltransferase